MHHNYLHSPVLDYPFNIKINALKQDSTLTHQPTCSAYLHSS